MSREAADQKEITKSGSGPTATIDINLNLVRQILLGDYVEIENLKVPKYSKFVADSLLLALRRDNEEQKTILDALTMAFTSLEEWNCMNVWKEIQTFRQSDSPSDEVRVGIINKYCEKIPEAYKETLRQCSKYDGPVEHCFDNLELMLFQQFQEFIANFMETESFIHLKRTLLADFMTRQQGGKQTLDNVLGCIMGNFILFAFVSPEVQEVFGEQNSSHVNEIAMKRIVFYLEAVAFEHLQNRSDSFVRAHAIRIFTKYLDEEFTGECRYKDIETRVHDKNSPVLAEIFSILKQDTLEWLMSDVFPIVKESKFLKLVKTLNDEQLSQKLPRAPSTFHADSSSEASSSFINRLALKFDIDLESEEYHQWFNCALDKDGFLYQGSFYIFSRHIIFTCNVMGVLKQSLCLEISKIRRIKKRTTIAIFPTALEITMKNKTYMFRSFITRDLCFELVKKMMIEHRNKRSDTSDVSKMKSIHDRPHCTTTETEDSHMPPTRSVSLEDSVTNSGESAEVVRGGVDLTSVTCPETGESVLASLVNAQEDSVNYSSTQSLPSYEDSFLKGAELDFQQEYVLPFPISAFIQNFLVDDCKYSILTHAETAGHKEPKATRWVNDEASGWFKREYKYRADIKDVPSFVPGVPKDTAVEVIIRCKMLEPGAFVYHQRMESLDAPYANTFYLHEVWQIRQMHQKCHLKYFVGLEWRQTTWLANTIRTRAIKDSRSAGEAYFRRIQRKYTNFKPKNSKKSSKKPKVEKQPKEVKEARLKPRKDPSRDADSVFCLFIIQSVVLFVVIVYFAYEMREMRKELRNFLSHERSQCSR